MKIEKEKLKQIKGGISAAYISAVIRGFSTIMDFGRTIGSAVRRIQSGKYC